MATVSAPESPMLPQVIDFPSPALTADQYRALEMLLLGQSTTQVGRKLGVDRKTVWRWIHQNPVFAEKFNSCRLDAMEAVEQRLRRLSQKAVSVIEKHLDEGNLHAAISLVKIVHGLPKPVSESPQLILKHQVEQMMRDFWHSEPYSEKRNGQYMLDSRSFLGLSKDVYKYLARKHGLENGPVDELMEEIRTEDGQHGSKA